MILWYLLLLPNFIEVGWRTGTDELLSGNEIGNVASLSVNKKTLHQSPKNSWSVNKKKLFIGQSKKCEWHAQDIHRSDQTLPGFPQFDKKSFVLYVTPTQVLSERYCGKCILWDIIIVSFYGTFILYHHCISTFIVHIGLFFTFWNNQPGCGLVLTISQHYIHHSSSFPKI